MTTDFFFLINHFSSFFLGRGGRFILLIFVLSVSIWLRYKTCLGKCVTRYQTSFSSLPHVVSTQPPYFGAFGKLRKATISFVISVRPSVRVEQLGSHYTDFYEISDSIIFRKSVKKNQVSLKI